MNSPKLRFKEFINKWEPKLFEELYGIKNGLNKEKEAFGSGTPILNYMDVNKNTFIDIHDIKGKVNLTYSEIERFLVKNNDLFFTRTSENSEEIGLTCSYIGENINLVFSGFVLKASPKIKEIDSTFYSYYLRTFKKRKEIIKHSSITTRALTSGTLLSSMPINYTDIEEQQKIAKFLQKVDYRIQLQQEKINLLKKQKKGYMQKVFNAEDNLPKKAYLIEQLGLFYKGHTLSKKDLTAEGHSCVLYGQLYTEYNEVINSVKHKTLNTNGFQGLKGDLLIPSSGETAIDIARVSSLQENALLGGDLSVLRVNPKIADSSYLSYLINSKYKLNLAKLAQGASVVHLYTSVIKKLVIELPTLEQQYKVSSFLSTIDRKIQLEDTKRIALLKQKKAFLQQMFI